MKLIYIMFSLILRIITFPLLIVAFLLGAFSERATEIAMVILVCTEWVKEPDEIEEDL